MWDDLTSAVSQLLEEQEYAHLSLGLFLGMGGALFVALMWLRIWRWFFALMGLRA